MIPTDQPFPHQKQENFMLQTQSFRASLCEGEDLLPKVIDGIKFTDGDEVMPIVKDETQTAA